MPILSNPRHERFAQELAKGKSATEAYEAATIPMVRCGNHELFYVYLLVDPRNDEPFYVGKGTGHRYAAHWAQMRRGHVHNARKHCRLAEILANGKRVLEFCVADGLSEAAAFRLERRLIAAIGTSRLTNIVAGNSSKDERELAITKHWISRIWPFEQWLSFRPRSEKDIEMYHLISENFRGLERSLEERVAA